MIKNFSVSCKNLPKNVSEKQMMAFLLWKLLPSATLIFSYWLQQI